MAKLSFDAGKLLEKYNPDAFAMGYGSGVFPQNGYSKDTKPMVDLVFAVEDPVAWHKANMEKHPEDYSCFAKLMGSGLTAKIAEKGTGLHYNPFVDFEDVEIKYGVMSKDDLVDDLMNWRTLYVAGRMQKPTQILRADDDIAKAQDMNLESAVNASLLLLPETFSETSLFYTIASLSYIGDSRMGLGENPDKVKNIVDKSSGFFELYEKVLNGVEASRIKECVGVYIQDKDPAVTKTRLQSLPEGVLANLERNSLILQSDLSVKNYLQDAISKVVGQSSVIQTLKGVYSAGPSKSIRYVKEKRQKRKEALAKSLQ